MLCIEELEHAKRRGARIYAEITGYSFSCDAHDLVAPDPTARGAARAIQEAMDMAELNPEDIGLINCHATSTPLGDAAESRAINRVFGHRTTDVPAHSTKSMMGHLLGGASAVEAIASILVLEEGVVHSTVNLFEQDPEINLNVVTEVYEDRSIEHILSNSFGFGGQNAVIILSRFKG
jgi:3-oxoacyl-[acyl-carrier-protein] synthase II